MPSCDELLLTCIMGKSGRPGLTLQGVQGKQHSSCRLLRGQEGETGILHLHQHIPRCLSTNLLGAVSLAMQAACTCRSLCCQHASRFSRQGGIGLALDLHVDKRRSCLCILLEGQCSPSDTPHPSCRITVQSDGLLVSCPAGAAMKRQEALQGAAQQGDSRTLPRLFRNAPSCSGKSFLAKMRAGAYRMPTHHSQL